MTIPQILTLLVVAALAWVLFPKDEQPSGEKPRAVAQLHQHNSAQEGTWWETIAEQLARADQMPILYQPGEERAPDNQLPTEVTK